MALVLAVLATSITSQDDPEGATQVITDCPEAADAARDVALLGVVGAAIDNAEPALAVPERLAVVVTLPVVIALMVIVLLVTAAQGISVLK